MMNLICLQKDESFGEATFNDEDEYRADSDYEYESPFATEEELAAAAAAAKKSFKHVNLDASLSGDNNKKPTKVKRTPSAYTLFVKDFVRQHWKEASRNKAEKQKNSASHNKKSGVNMEQEKLIYRAARAWRKCDPDTKDYYLKQSRGGGGSSSSSNKPGNKVKFTRKKRIVKSEVGGCCSSSEIQKSDHGAEIESESCFALPTKKPISAYMTFVRAHATKGVRMSEQHKTLASKWKSMCEADKKPYLDMARSEKDHQEAMAAAASADTSRPKRRKPKVSYRKLHSGI